MLSNARRVADLAGAAFGAGVGGMGNLFLPHLKYANGVSGGIRRGTRLIANATGRQQETGRGYIASECARH